MVQYAHDKMFINDAGCTVPVVARKLLPFFLRYCAVCNMALLVWARVEHAMLRHHVRSGHSTYQSLLFLEFIRNVHLRYGPTF